MPTSYISRRLRARLAGRARRRGGRHPLGRGVPDRHPLLRRALRHPRCSAGSDPAPRQAAPPCRSHARAVDLGARPPRVARRRSLGPVASRRRRRAVRARAAQRGVAPARSRRTVSSSATSVDSRPRSRSRICAPSPTSPGSDSSSSATAPTGRRSNACCPVRTSPDSSAATIWPRDGGLRRVRAPGRERDVLPDDPGGDGERRPRGRHGRRRPLDLVRSSVDGWLYVRATSPSWQPRARPHGRRREAARVLGARP